MAPRHSSFSSTSPVPVVDLPFLAATKRRVTRTWLRVGNFKRKTLYYSLRICYSAGSAVNGEYWVLIMLAVATSHAFLLHMCSPSLAWSSLILNPAARCNFKLHDLLVSMSVGKEQHSTTAVDSNSDDDDVAPGPPGRLGVNLATSQCQLEAVRRLHSSLDPERDYLERSACQTAAGRALWNHVIHDPLAEVFAGDVLLRGLLEKVRRDQDQNARETAGVMMAVRTLWFDARLAEALARFDSVSTDNSHQVVLLGAGMDARAYRLRSLKDCSVFEVDSAKALHLKESILQAMVEAGESLPRLEAKSLNRVASDIAVDDWFDRLVGAGFKVHLPTVWILEGFLYYLQEACAKETLTCISGHCMNETVVLADFMNESSTHLAHELKTHFYFHSDWPEELLPGLGFPQVKVSQIGDPDANFGLINDELNLFHQMRRVSRHVKADVNGKPYRRLLLVESWASFE